MLSGFLYITNSNCIISFRSQINSQNVTFVGCCFQFITIYFSGPTNSNSEIKTASPINGIAFSGNFTNNRIVPISQSNATANNSRVLLANSRMAPVQNLLSGVVLQQPTSQVQQTGSVGFLRLQSPVNARNITTIPRTPTPNANQINKQSTVFTLNTTGGVPLRIPLQGQQLRSSVALLQQVGNSSSSAPIVLQQPLLVQQQQHGRPFLVLQQPVTTGKQQASHIYMIYFNHCSIVVF